jgi:hypothetical protein
MNTTVLVGLAGIFYILFIYYLLIMTSLIDLSNMITPPDVVSISYGAYERYQDSDYLATFDIQAMKLGN